MRGDPASLSEKLSLSSQPNCPQLIGRTSCDIRNHTQTLCVRHAAQWLAGHLHPCKAPPYRGKKMGSAVSRDRWSHELEWHVDKYLVQLQVIRGRGITYDKWRHSNHWVSWTLFQIRHGRSWLYSLNQNQQRGKWKKGLSGSLCKRKWLFFFSAQCGSL